MFSQTSFLAPSKAAPASMVQARPHQHEDLNHLIVKAKPHQAIVRNGACLGAVGPQQRQCCLNCYVCYCTSHKHPNFWCLPPNPPCGTLGLAVRIPAPAVLLLTAGVSEPPCLQKQALKHEPSILRGNNFNFFCCFFYFFPYCCHLFKEAFGGLTQDFQVLLSLGRVITKSLLQQGHPGKPCDNCSALTPMLRTMRGGYLSS